MPRCFSQRRRWLVVNIDGCCFNNGRDGAQAGWGVFFGPRDSRNCCGALPVINGNASQTNQRAELFAIFAAIAVTQDVPNTLLIKTDSRYAINCLVEWFPKWETKRFITAKGTPVKNRVLIQGIVQLLREREGVVRFLHVPGHSGDYYSDEADRLAKLGASKNCK